MKELRGTIGLLLVMAITWPSGASNTTTNQPNIVLINIDDMGWKDVGFMESEYYETPNIDQLSTQGMVFTNGYAAASNCAPSRACLMTGQWTPRHGIYTVNSSERGNAKDRKLIPTENTTILAKDHIIIPEILKDHGYRTCHAGKWHLSDNPLEYGFDVNIRLHSFSILPHMRYILPSNRLRGWLKNTKINPGQMVNKTPVTPAWLKIWIKTLVC